MNDPGMTPEQLNAMKKLVAMNYRGLLEMAVRCQVLQEQVARLLCGENLTPEKIEAVKKELEGEINRRFERRLIDTDKISGELAALADDQTAFGGPQIPSPPKPGESPPPHE